MCQTSEDGAAAVRGVGRAREDAEGREGFGIETVSDDREVRGVGKPEVELFEVFVRGEEVEEGNIGSGSDLQVGDELAQVRDEGYEYGVAAGGVRHG